MKKIQYLEKPAGLVIPGLKGAAQCSSLGIGKNLDDGTVLTSMELDDGGVIHFGKATKDGKPVRVKFKNGEKNYEAAKSCMHASKLGGFLLEEETEEVAKPVQQQGNQRR